MKKIPTGAWVVVADGTGARLLRNVGKGLNVSLEQVKLVGPKDAANDGPAGRQPPELGPSGHGLRCPGSGCLGLAELADHTNCAGAPGGAEAQ